MQLATQLVKAGPDEHLGASEIARYYCGLIGQGGKMINIGPNAQNMRLEGISMWSGKSYSFEFDVEE